MLIPSIRKEVSICKIATEQEAYNIGKQGSPNSNRCATNARANALGCKKLPVSDNKLVQVSDLVADIFDLGKIKVTGRISSSMIPSSTPPRYNTIWSASIQVENAPTAPVTFTVHYRDNAGYTVYSGDVIVNKGNKQGSNGGAIVTAFNVNTTLGANDCSIITKGFTGTFY